MDEDMNGKVVVVTGAAGRLGRQVVQRFAERGATIAAVVRDEEEARSIPFPQDAEGWAFPGDVTDEETVVACFEEIGRQFGRIDVLVHTVGGWKAWALRETSLADWERLLRTNLTSTFLCFREAAGLMEEGGRLIALAAMQGADRGTARQAAYAAAKAGVIRLVEATAAEFAEAGVTAHAVAPSTILYDDEGDDATGVSAAQVVDLCLYLCTDAGGALSGATLRTYGTQQ